jgi:hypothetical protein
MGPFHLKMRKKADMSPELAQQLTTKVGESLKEESCIEVAIVFFGLLQKLYNISVDQIQINSIPVLEGPPTNFQHVWLEMNGLSFDPMRQKYEILINEAREKDLIQKNNPSLVVLFQSNTS